MNYKTYALVAALASGLGLGWAFNYVSQAQTAAQQAQRHWEYCVVSRAGAGPASARGEYVVRYLTRGNVETVGETATGGGALGRKIAELGNAGWELTAAGPYEFKANAGVEALYFKRRVP
jgi:hypothetical protein